MIKVTVIEVMEPNRTRRLATFTFDNGKLISRSIASYWIHSSWVRDLIDGINRIHRTRK